MRISAKGRYALAAMANMAGQYGSGEHITVISLSERLGISKIYLEQVFSLLKRGGLVTSVKGSQGGYLLSRAPGEITALDILSAVELALFEREDSTAGEKAPEIDEALAELVFRRLDVAIEKMLRGVTLADIASEAQKRTQAAAPMFYI